MPTKRFVKATADKLHRVIMIGEGADGSGKTHFGLTAPGPIGLINTDSGLEGVLEKFAGDKDIYVSDYLDDYLSIDLTPDSGNEAFMTKYGPLWTKIREDYEALLKDENIKTIIIDSFTTTWEIIRYAMLGRTALPLEYAYKYGPVNNIYIKMVQRAFLSHKNLILLHRLKDKYVDDKRTGELELDGCKKTPYEVQSRVRFTNNVEDGVATYSFTITKARQNGMALGISLSNESCNFPMLATLLFPDTQIEDWQ